jgi:hypothetical protein
LGATLSDVHRLRMPLWAVDHPALCDSPLRKAQGVKVPTSGVLCMLDLRSTAARLSCSLPSFLLYVCLSR